MDVPMPSYDTDEGLGSIDAASLYNLRHTQYREMSEFHTDELVKSHLNIAAPNSVEAVSVRLNTKISAYLVAAFGSPRASLLRCAKRMHAYARTGLQPPSFPLCVALSPVTWSN